jgi:hypothetical protein
MYCVVCGKKFYGERGYSSHWYFHHLNKGEYHNIVKYVKKYLSCIKCYYCDKCTMLYINNYIC